MGLVALIDRPGFRIASDRKVIKRAEAAQLGVISDAYERAKAEIAAATADAERERRQLFETVYEQAMERARQEAAQTLVQTQIDRELLLRSLQPQIVDIILDALTLLVTQVDRQRFYARALEQIKDALRADSGARLCVDPASEAAAKAALSSLQDADGLLMQLRIVVDSTLSAGSCVLESKFGSVDASLSVQLQAIRSALEQTQLLAPEQARKVGT